MTLRHIWLIFWWLIPVTQALQIEEFTLADIQSWPEYRAAELDPTLRLRKKDNEPPTPKRNYDRVAIAREVEQILDRFGIDGIGQIEWSSGGNWLDLKMPEGERLHGYFDTSNRLFEVSIQLPELPTSYAAATDKESFYEWAVAVYKKVFGASPIGTPLDYRFGAVSDWKGIGSDLKNSVVWQASINGVLCKTYGAVGMERKGDYWCLSVNRCASLEELDDLANVLQRTPVRYTKRQSICQVMKNWQALTKRRRESDKWLVVVEKGYFSPKTIYPFNRLRGEPESVVGGTSFSLHKHYRLWFPALESKTYYPDLYCYKILFQNGEDFQVNALMNWHDGTVLRLDEALHAW